MNSFIVNKKTCSTHIVATTLGALVGLAGINHGLFEVLQGNVKPEGYFISAIGPSQRFWEYGFETALTIVPNIMVTSILAVAFGILVTIWSFLYIDRSFGPGILLVLSIILFLVGGGFGPIFMAIIASLTATRINKPAVKLVDILPTRLNKLLAKIWFGVLVVFMVVFLISVEIAVFGWPLTLYFNADTTLKYLNSIAYVMLALMLLAVFTGLVHDAIEAHKS